MKYTALTFISWVNKFAGYLSLIIGVFAFFFGQGFPALACLFAGLVLIATSELIFVFIDISTNTQAIGQIKVLIEREFTERREYRKKFENKNKTENISEKIAKENEYKNESFVENNISIDEKENGDKNNILSQTSNVDSIDKLSITSAFDLLKSKKYKIIMEPTLSGEFKCIIQKNNGTFIYIYSLRELNEIANLRE